jgi:serine/threonine protein kinase/tetratricopeptide (TPR) repeat protein
MTDITSDHDDFTLNLRIEQLLDDFEKLCRKGNFTEIASFLTANLDESAAVRQEFVRIAQQYEIDLSKLAQKAGNDRLDQEATIEVRGIPQHAIGRTSRYVVLRPHARGGLGQVSIALDSELNRHVALKEILPDHADDKKRQERFLQEAEITGQLEHPGIVPVYGLGAYTDGRPYYAMRFVEGESLRSAIDAFHISSSKGSSLTTGERGVRFRHLLGSFMAICQAMHYAHCRCVLHRDLKPDNIMLGPYGETLVVDWGLAKPIDALKSDSGDFESGAGSGSGSQPIKLKSRDSHGATLEGSAVGTPAYMSPEQAAGKLSSLGPPTDIYSLGATLFALLTGQAPFKQEDAFSLLTAVREGRFESPRQVNRYVPKALDAICVKAMAKSPTDRYPTARELAEDVERFLADEPVKAMPESTLSRLGRWTRRNRSFVGYAAASLIFVTVVSVVAAISNNRLRKEAEHQQQIAVNQRVKATALAEENEKIAQANLLLAESEKRKSEEATKLALEKQNLADAMATLAAEERAQRVTSEKLSEFLTGLFYAADPIGINVDFFIPKANSERLTASDILNRGAERVATDQALAQSPLAKAQILHAIGDVNRQLGRFKESESLLKEALEIRKRELGDNHLLTAASLHALGQYHHERGNFDQAKPLYEQAIAIREKAPGVEGQKAKVASLHNLAWMMANDGDAVEAEKLFREVLELKRAIYGDLHRETAFSKMGIAFSLIEQQRMLEVAPYVVSFKTDLEKLEGSGSLVEAITSFATALATQQLLGSAAAEPGLRTALDSIQRGLGEDNVYTALIHCELGTCLHKQNKLTEAESNYRAALKIAREKVQLQHPRIILLVGRFTRLLSSQGKSSEAMEIWNEFIAAQRFRFGEGHRYVAEALFEFGDFLREAKQYDESTAAFRAFLKIADAARKNLDYSQDMAYFQIGRNYLERESGDFVEAEKAIRASLAALAADAKNKRDYASDEAFTLIQLARAICLQGRIAEAQEVLARAHSISISIKSGKDQQDFRDRHAETRIFLLRRAGEAEALLNAYGEWIKEKTSRLGPAAEGTLQAKEELARIHESLEQYPTAIELRRECLAARESRLPAADRTLLSARDRLARTLLAAKRYDEALPILETVYEKRNAEKNAATALALGHLLIVNEALGNHDTAQAQWTTWHELTGKLNSEAPAKLISTQAAFARVLLEHGLFERAMSLLPEVVAYRNANEPDEWTTFTAQSMLGHAHLGLKRLADAEPLLRNSWEGIAAREAKIPPASMGRVREALERMVALEEELSRPDEAARWRTMLEQRSNLLLLEVE